MKFTRKFRAVEGGGGVYFFNTPLNDFRILLNNYKFIMDEKCRFKKKRKEKYINGKKNLIFDLILLKSSAKALNRRQILLIDC